MEAPAHEQDALLSNSTHTGTAGRKEELPDDAAVPGSPVTGVDINGAYVNSTDKVPNNGAAMDASRISGKHEGKIQQLCASSVLTNIVSKQEKEAIGINAKQI
ncbi:hypothetical protein scyTo_0020865 [Scyliorhinus torazame]|uniref:Uncharacterized protein n=1 Tax=Scyliorhinus torazame TaxID=75743 RepID=A0A401PPN3_SCYTO|nr:hypothetical protein [Scyliorhinus torazame]